MSVGLKIIFVMFIIYEFYAIFSRKHPKVSIKHLVQPFAIDNSESGLPWSPQQFGFDMALAVSDAGAIISLNPAYGRVTLTQGAGELPLTQCNSQQNF